MFANATVSTTKTPLDYMAEGYWQDFLAQRAIAGGIAYEQPLHTCQLDESLLSLQRIDILLSQIRRDIIRSDTLSEASVLVDERYRNLFIFLAFYAGRVLAAQGHYIPNWYGQFELAKRFPNLPIVEDDFYQHIAVVYCNNTDNAESNDRVLSSLFFALEPIGQRLFGNIDRQFTAVQGGQVASGLYQAVLERLPKTVANENLETKSSDTINVNDKRSVNDDLRVKDSIATIDNSDDNDNATQSIANKALIKESTLSETDSVKSSLVNRASSEPSFQESVPQQVAVTTNQPVAPTPEMFTQLLDELNRIEVAQTNGNEDYSQACKILDQFERHIARQKTARSEAVFSDAHQQQRQQALIKLQDAASVGHTGAMLRLAMYELLGEGLVAGADNNTNKKASKEAGIELVKQAANANDSRGQRLLSRLYYRGFGITQDIQSGRHWLEQAAKNGHSEAATLVAEWQQAQTLITTRQQEQHSTKRYQWLIIAVIIAAIALIIFA